MTTDLTVPPFARLFDPNNATEREVEAYWAGYNDEMLPGYVEDGLIMSHRHAHTAGRYAAEADKAEDWGLDID